MDDPTLDNFIQHVTTNGIAISTVTDGTIIAITANKLRELLKIAESNSDKQIIMFVKRAQPQDSFKQ